MNLSPQQESAISAVKDWHRNPTNPVFYLAGYAGTGKTTLAKMFAENVSKKTRFAAFSGKAAMVMRKNGCADASTIHSTIYKVEIDEDTGQRTFKRRHKSDMLDVGLLVIDECSMVNEEIGRDLLSFNVPILVLGDPAQLPPVSGAGYFTSGNPNFFLTEIHRQAAENPIVRVATDIREGKRLSLGEMNQVRIISKDQVSTDDVLAADQVLVGINRTRTMYNARMRSLKGYCGDVPSEGEQLICLKNDSTLGCFNGGMWRVLETKAQKQGHIDDGCVDMALASLDFDNSQPIDVKVRKEFFDGRGHQIDWKERRGTQEFDYGYAITVHKSQGSQWGSIYLFDESSAFASSRQQWLYTAVTRAAEQLTVVLS